MVLTMVRGVWALTEPLLASMVTALPLTVAEAVSRAAPQISQRVMLVIDIVGDYGVGGNGNCAHEQQCRYNEDKFSFQIATSWVVFPLRLW